MGSNPSRCSSLTLEKIVYNKKTNSVIFSKENYNGIACVSKIGKEEGEREREEIIIVRERMCVFVRERVEGEKE